MATAYVREINSIDQELKRLRAHIKELTTQRLRAQTHLHQYMVRHQLDEVEGIKLTKITPKPKTIRKSLKEKKQAALELCLEVGINDPDLFWEQWQKTQKPPKVEEEQEATESYE